MITISFIDIFLLLLFRCMKGMIVNVECVTDGGVLVWWERFHIFLISRVGATTQPWTPQAGWVCVRSEREEGEGGRGQQIAWENCVSDGVAWCVLGRVLAWRPSRRGHKQRPTRRSSRRRIT